MPDNSVLTSTLVISAGYMGEIYGRYKAFQDHMNRDLHVYTFKVSDTTKIVRTKDSEDRHSTWICPDEAILLLKDLSMIEIWNDLRGEKNDRGQEAETSESNINRDSKQSKKKLI